MSTLKEVEAVLNKENKPTQHHSYWTNGKEFILSQAKVILILAFAYFCDQWEPSYPRNENHNMPLFWVCHAVLAIVTFMTWERVPPRDSNGGSIRVTPLSRCQTEEWKGWMQFAFIMYHYYRAWSAYNWIRVFVSSYVWMTGFGNFLYFDKKRDFSISRMISMWIRINYFPLLLSWSVGVPLDLYYVVPLHTVGFFITLVTCRFAFFLEENCGVSYWNSRVAAIAFSLLVHVCFYETPNVDFLLKFSDEIHFRFQADKYSAWIGIVCGFLMKRVTQYMAWAYGGAAGDKTHVKWAQRIFGILLIVAWYQMFGYIDDKYKYNAYHPYVFFIPLLGWLMVRNSSRYLTESHSTFLEFLGRNTLETYVLQFHLFMNHSVQHIPVIIPGSESDGNIYLKTANMLLCGIVFVAVAVQARKITVSTQTSVTNVIDACSKPAEVSSDVDMEETVVLTEEPVMVENDRKNLDTDAKV